MGLGLTRPDLLIIPGIAIVAWIALDILAFFVMCRIHDRRERRRTGPAVRRRRGLQTVAPAPPPQLDRICPWCSGKGDLAAPLVTHFGLRATTPGGEAPCPRCGATGYVDADGQDWDALRRRLVKQEWKE